MRIKRHVFYTRSYVGRWRTARVQHRCDWRPHGTRCFNRIAAGEEYFDTNIKNTDSSNAHATRKCCKSCANTEIQI